MRKKSKAIFLGIFLGIFGAHNFYIKRNRIAIIQLLFTGFGIMCGTLSLAIIVFIWSIIEVLLIAFNLIDINPICLSESSTFEEKEEFIKKKLEKYSYDKFRTLKVLSKNKFINTDEFNKIYDDIFYTERKEIDKKLIIDKKNKKVIFLILGILFVLIFAFGLFEDISNYNNSVNTTEKNNSTDVNNIPEDEKATITFLDNNINEERQINRTTLLNSLTKLNSNVISNAVLDGWSVYDKSSTLYFVECEKTLNDGTTKKVYKYGAITYYNMIHTSQYNQPTYKCFTASWNSLNDISGTYTVISNSDFGYTRPNDAIQIRNNKIVNDLTQTESDGLFTNIRIGAINKALNSWLENGTND